MVETILIKMFLIKNYVQFRFSEVETDSISFVFVTTFNLNNKNVFILIQIVFKLLQQSHERREFFKERHEVNKNSKTVI